jgi:hypothetical protein
LYIGLSVIVSFLYILLKIFNFNVFPTLREILDDL